jgi:hypothetical protein
MGNKGEGGDGTHGKGRGVEMQPMGPRGKRGGKEVAQVKVSVCWRMSAY